MNDIDNDIKPERHFFASTAFDWAIAETRQEAINRVAKAAGASVIKAQGVNGGLYVWTCEVPCAKDSRHYSINHYAPEFYLDDEGKPDQSQPVDFRNTQQYLIQNTKGHVVVKD